MSSSDSLEIVYQDEFLVAVNKPHGLLVHRSPIAADASEFAVQLLRDKLGKRVYPVHRLDRKTGGTLLFALSEELNSIMQQRFASSEISKTYHAIVRGHTPDAGEIDYPLKKDDGTIQDAFTAFETISRTEIPFASGIHPTSRYSLVKLMPRTGRMHQLRKHMAHIFHPIIGDRPHGCNKQNRFFKEQFKMETMMLHATNLLFTHPITDLPITITSNYHSEFQRTLSLLNLTK